MENLAGTEKVVHLSQCGSERGEVDFVLYFMRFGDRGGRRGRTADGGRRTAQ